MSAMSLIAHQVLEWTIKTSYLALKKSWSDFEQTINLEMHQEDKRN